MTDLGTTARAAASDSVPAGERARSQPPGADTDGHEAPALGSAHDPFSRALRVGGALLLALSASTFMFQHWSSQGDVARYFMLLGHTLVIAVAALLCSTKLRAARSARTLFALVLGSAPVHATVVGALLYSRFGAARAHLPSAAMWAAPSAGAALAAAAAALAVLVPAGALALRVLTRGHAMKLGLALGLSNALLLVPTREPALVGIGLLAATFALLGADTRFETRHELRTFEGRAVRVLCFVPIAIIAGRTVIFYDVTRTFAASALLAAAWIWFTWCAHVRGHLGAALAQRTAVLPVMLSASIMASALPDDWTCAAFALLSCCLLVAMGQRALGGAAFYRLVAGYLTCATLLLDAASRATPASALIAVLGGTAAAIAAAGLQRIGLLIVAGSCTLLAVGLELVLVVDVSALRHWGTLAVAGLALVLGAALLERYGGRLGQRARLVRQTVGGWEW